MKKSSAALVAVLAFLAGVLLALVLMVFLKDQERSPGSYKVDPESGVTNRLLTSAALETAGALRSGDYAALAELVHPDYGLVFSPYATVNLNANLHFTPAEVADFGTNTQKLTWGVVPDSGEPITMTVSDYMARYVFDHDYTKCQLMGLNYTVRTGNSRENVTEFFPGAQYADLCYPGTAENEYADWRILRLVFEEYAGELKLTAIIHSESTL